jgi:hypothetical protein
MGHLHFKRRQGNAQTQETPITDYTPLAFRSALCGDKSMTTHQNTERNESAE